MLCTTCRQKLSNAIDSNTVVPLGVKAHIDTCSECKQYYEQLQKIEQTMTICPDAGLANYDFNKLNARIFDKIEETDSTPLTITYPTQTFNNKYAVAATALIALALTLSIFTNLINDRSSNTLTKTEIAGSNNTTETTDTLADADPTETNNTPETVPGYTPVFSPQTAVIYHLATLPYSSIAKLPYKEKFQESQEVYEKTQEITEKSSKVINTVFQNSFMYLKPF